MNEQKQFQEKFNQLSEVEKNDIYRAVLYEYVPDYSHDFSRGSSQYLKVMCFRDKYFL